MTQKPTEPLADIHKALLRLTQAWALRRPFDAERARDLRRQAILLNHEHYLQTIPAYQQLAREAGIGLTDDVGAIVEQLMVSDDLFKSYSQRWLDANDFTRMNRWLSFIHHRQVNVDVEDVCSIDGWIDRLGQHDVMPVYSSGTSGAFSFIPRDRAMWELVRMANTCYLLPLLTYNKLGSSWQRLLTRWAAAWLSPSNFSQAVSSLSVKPFDAVFLDFQGGRTGMQAIGEELTSAFRRTTFLYPIRLSANVLRSLRRGPKSEEEFAALQAVQAETSGRRHIVRLRWLSPGSAVDSKIMLWEIARSRRHSMIQHAREQIQCSSEEDLGTVANVITLLRITISLLLFCAAAYQHNPMLNLAGLAVHWVGDVADGFLARRLNQETLFGAQWDILGDRISVAFFYLNSLWMYPYLLPSIALFLVQFMVLDHYLSNQYMRWPVMSPNYFYRVDRTIWALNWSKLGKACNTGLVTFLLLATKSNAVVLPVVIALLVVKLYSCVRLMRLREPTVRIHEPRPSMAPEDEQPQMTGG